MNELGRFLKKARKARRLRLRHVAAAIGKSIAYMSDLENGRRGKNLNPNLAVQLAEFLNVPVTTLFTLSGVTDIPTAEKAADYLKLVRNKERASRLADAIDVATETALLLCEMADDVGVPSIKQLAEKLIVSIHDIEIALKIG